MVDLYRCPNQTLKDASPQHQMWVDLLMRAYIQMDARHVLPVDGGLLNQTRSFVAACEIIDAERGRLETLKQEKRERDREAAQRKANTGARRHGR